MFPDHDDEPLSRYPSSTVVRMAQMMVPIDQAIMLTDDLKERLMLACAMLQRVREIFDAELTEEGRRLMFKDLS